MKALLKILLTGGIVTGVGFLIIKALEDTTDNGNDMFDEDVHEDTVSESTNNFIDDLLNEDTSEGATD